MPATPRLLRSDARQLAGRLHFATKPFGRNVEAVWPCRRAEFEKDARNIGLVAQRLEHGPWLADHRGEVVHAFAAVVEANPQPEVAEFFETGDFTQHRDLCVPIWLKFD